MANLEFCDKHNMVAYLEKTEGSEGFHQIIDFLTASHINYALTESPTIYASLIEQFWQTAALSTIKDGVMEITTTIDGRVKTITEASIRRHLKLEDSDGISTLPTAEIFEQLALMGMLVQGPIQQGEGSTVPVESHHIPITTPSTSQPPLSSPSRVPTPPHDSPLPGGHTPGSDEGNKPTRFSNVTQVIYEVKKLEHKVKSRQPRRRARVVISDTEEDLEDPSKQGRRIAEIDQNPSISLVQDEGTSWIQEDAEIQGRTSADTEILLDQEEPTELVGDLGSGEKGEKEIIKTKKQLKQERFGHEEAFRLQEQINEEERQRIARDAKIAKQLQEEFDRARQEQEVVAEADQAHDIDWSDPAVLRYHAVQNRSFSKAEVRKNMCIYLKNQGGYKQSHFKGMKYEDIRPIFERVWDQNQSFVPMDSELEVQRLKRAGQDVVEEPAKRQRTGEASGSVQEQTCEEPKAEELSQEQLHQMIMVIPVEEVYVEALQVKYLIIDWEIYSEDTRKYWKIIRVGGHTEAYQTFDDMLKKFDRDDLDKLWNLVKERFRTTEPTEDKARELWVELNKKILTSGPRYSLDAK
ncbi:hypothetical protein Tco_0861941 [Tanacetum coccineum]